MTIFEGDWSPLFLWELATGVAGAVLEINVFDQPNVQESKDYTKAYLETFAQTGLLPESSPLLTDGTVRVYADERKRQCLKGASTVEAGMAVHLSRIQSGDYFAINAYVERTDAVPRLFQRIRARVRETKQVATTLG